MALALRQSSDQEDGVFTLSVSTPQGSERLKFLANVDYQVIEEGDELVIVSPSDPKYIIASGSNYGNDLNKMILAVETHVLSLGLRIFNKQILEDTEQSYAENHIRFKKKEERAKPTAQAVPDDTNRILGLSTENN